VLAGHEEKWILSTGSQVRVENFFNLPKIKILAMFITQEFQWDFRTPPLAGGTSPKWRQGNNYRTTWKRICRV